MSGEEEFIYSFTGIEDISSFITCPITYKIFTDPVDGHTYERYASCLIIISLH